MDHAHEKRKPAEERYERDHRDNDLDDDGPHAELLGPLRRIEGTIVVADSPQNATIKELRRGPAGKTRKYRRARTTPGNHSVCPTLGLAGRHPGAGGLSHPYHSWSRNPADNCWS